MLRRMTKRNIHFRCRQRYFTTRLANVLRKGLANASVDRTSKGRPHGEKEILDRIQKYVDPFRITKGKGFRLKDFDPGDTCGLQLDKGEAADSSQRGTEWLAEEQDMLYAQDRWSLAARLPGDGRGRQRRHDQARHVGRQSSGMPGVLVQAALVGGARPRLHVALRQSACPSAGASASSTVRTTRKSSSCACTRRS